MNPFGRGIVKAWGELGPRFLPFADAATPELPLGRLMRLSLFQVTVGMAAVLLIGTLNRVMIVELGVPAWLVATMVSLPLLFAPARALVGYRSDTHRSALGWRRVPFIWTGTLVQFGGLAIMPFALILLSGDVTAGPSWIGQPAAALAFLMVGAGLHTVQTVGLALATDLAPERARPKVVALLCVMLLVGMVLSATVFGALLANFSQLRLIQVIQGAAVLTMVVNIIALWKQEPRDPGRNRNVEAPRFGDAWAAFLKGDKARRRLVATGIGTAAFSMQDVLLEPYGGQILKLSVGATTAFTAVLAAGGIAGLVLAARRLNNGADPHRVAALGVVAGIFAFSCVAFSAPLGSGPLFGIGVALIGFGGGLFGHGTLTATMESARRTGDVGLALGAWGAVQATAAGLAIAAGGIMRDIISDSAVHHRLGDGLNDASAGYVAVYHTEILLLFVTLVAIGPLVRRHVGPAGAASSFDLARAPG
ncbi:BCD family MFS transporter [Alsobacter sp. R-9]